MSWSLIGLIATTILALLFVAAIIVEASLNDQGPPDEN